MSTATKRTAALVLGPELAGTLMSSEEFDRAKESDRDYNYELIHGVLIVSPPPLEAERDPNGELEYLLRLYREQHPQGAALDKTLSEQSVRTATSRRRADRVIWAGLGRLPNIKVDPPTIVVEFVSKGKRNRLRDYEERRQEYQEVGIAEYWLIDRFQRIMTIYRHTAGKPSTVVVKEPESYRTPLLPGFELPLARLLKLADAWGQ
jgi:Uma2 family endonuclease